MHGEAPPAKAGTSTSPTSAWDIEWPSNGRHDLEEGNVVLEDYYPEGWVAMGASAGEWRLPLTYAAANRLSPCVKSAGMWHVALVWGHGITDYTAIVDLVHQVVPRLFLAFQKIIQITSVGPSLRQSTQMTSHELALGTLRRKRSTSKMFHPKSACS